MGPVSNPSLHAWILPKNVFSGATVCNSMYTFWEFYPQYRAMLIFSKPCPSIVLGTQSISFQEESRKIKIYHMPWSCFWLVLPCTTLKVGIGLLTDTAFCKTTRVVEEREYVTWLAYDPTAQNVLHVFTCFVVQSKLTRMFPRLQTRGAKSERFHVK